MRGRATLVLPLLLAAAPSPALAQWEEAAAVRRTIDAWRVEWGVPGAAVAVVRDGEVLLVEGFGVRRLGGEGAVDEATAFELGSASKTFTATLVALAVEEGLIEWGTRLVDLLPELRLGDPLLEREITVLDALAHRTGFARNDVLWLGGATPAEILRRARFMSPAAAFRAEFGYSNLMYILVAEAVGRVFDRGWEQALAERLTGPLGLRATGVWEEGGGGRANVAAPHVQIGDSIESASTPRTHAGPAGGILSTAEDLAAWMQYQLDAAGAVREMQERRTPIPLEAFGAQYARASELGYGAGWFVSDYAGRRMVDHIGGHGGMVANVSLLPDEGIGVAVLTNHGDNLLPVAVTYRIFDLLLGLDSRPWNRTLMAFWEDVRIMRAAATDAPGGARIEDAPSRLPAAAYAGRYTSPVYGEVGVDWDGEALILEYGSNLRGRLSHWHHDTYRVTWSEPILAGILGRSFVSFQLDMAGGPAGLRMTGFQGELVEATRVPGDLAEPSPDAGGGGG